MINDETGDIVQESCEKKDKAAYEADIAAVGQRIEEYNSHWLNHKHLVSAFGVVVMGLIFIGMLFTAVEVYMWGLCGVLLLGLVIIMWWRGELAKRMNSEMDAAVMALKEYERGRRKKK